MKLTEILDDYHIEWKEAGHRHVTQGWIGINCAHCGDTEFKLGYNLNRGCFTCWSCGWHPTIATLSLLIEEPHHKCRELLSDLSLDRQEKPSLRGKLILPACIGPLQPSHRKYLQARGFDPDELVKLWSIQGIGIAPRLAWRIFIPIHLPDGQVVSWTTRSIGKTNPRRYIAASASEEMVKAKDLLYGEQFAKHSIVVTEGPLDAWKIGAGAVATLGTGFSRAQVCRMVRFPIRYICFDSDRQAQKRARQLCDALECFPGKTIRVELEAKDAATANEKEIKCLRRLLK